MKNDTYIDVLRRAVARARTARRRATAAELRAFIAEDRAILAAVEAGGRGGQAAVARELDVTREYIRQTGRRLATRVERLAALEAEEGEEAEAA